MKDHQQVFAVGKMCRVFQVSRSGYYHWLNRKPSPRELENQELRTNILEVHKLTKFRLGSPKMQKEIKEKRQYANESQLQERFASQIKEQQEWDVNFPPLPKVYKLDYNSIKGNEVTNLALTNRLNLGRGASVYALGLVGECDKAKSYLIMKRASDGGVSYSSYGILKLDNYGNRMGYREIGKSENNGSGFTRMDLFTITATGFGNATVETIQRTQDGEYKDTFTHYCGY